MNWGFLTSIVSALSGLGGVWLGGELTSRRERRRERDEAAKELTYLAILVTAHLQRFVDGCVSVVGDDGTSYGQPSGEDGYHESTVETPSFEPLTFEVNWKSLPPQLMDEIMSLPYHIESLNRQIAGVGDFDDPPEFSHYFWERRHGYAVLGLKVSALADRLRQHAGLDVVPVTQGDWSRDAHLEETKLQLERHREQRPQFTGWTVTEQIRER
jgi:hypothetical protein